MLDRRGLWNLCNLLTENNQHVVLTEEQKGHKLCSFVLMSKVICLHVSRVSARNFLSTDFTLFFLVIFEIRGEMEVIIPA